MITSIRLVNWRSHKNTHLEFGKGTNLLVGIMGGGKSSVLEGISFALFGTFPTLERRRVKLDDIIRFNEPHAKIVLEMKWNGGEYRIERKIERKEKRTGTKAEVFKGGSLIDSGPKSVTAYVEQLLGVDYDLFTRAIYSEQNNIDYFLNLDPRKRKEEIDRLLGLDKFEDARMNIVAVINRTVSNRKTLEDKFDKKEMEDTVKIIEQYGKEIAEFEKKQTEIAGEYEKSSKETSRLEEKFKLSKAEKEKYENNEKELTRIKAMIESVKPEISKDASEEEFEKLKERMDAINKELAGLKKNKNEMEGRRSELSKEIGSIENIIKSENERKGRIEKLKKALEQLGKRDKMREELKKTEEESLKLNSERKSLEDKLSETKEMFEKLKPGMGDCPLCGSKLDEKGVDHIKKEKKELIEKSEKRLKEINSTLPRIEKEIESIELKIRKMDFADEKIESLEKESKNINELENKKKDLEKRNSELIEKLELNEEAIGDKQKKSNETVRSVDKIKDSLDKKRKLSLFEEKEKELVKTREALKYDEKEYEKLRAELENSRLKKQKLESDKSSIEQQLKMKKETKDLHEKRINEMKGMERRMSELSKLSDELKIYKNALLDTQVTLRKNLIEAINAAMNEVWEIFYPYKNYQAVRLGVTEKDYVFEVHERGEWKSLETVASGGERACAALTLRVALATVLTPNLSWLILDEPTHNLDKEAVALLSETLQLKVPQVVNQTFVITHEEGLIGADFATSYRLVRTKETDGPTESDRI